MDFFVFTSFLVFLGFQLSASRKCKSLNAQKSFEFYPLRHCQRSNKTVIAFYNVDSLEGCVDFANKHRGLAFNFSPKDRYKTNLFELVKLNETARREFKHDKNFFNCEVLDCPEYRNLSSIVNDTRFDYYSLYTHPPREFTSNKFFHDFSPHFHSK
jgi:hypothetical protein